jgi:hypothetical protein
MPAKRILECDDDTGNDAECGATLSKLGMGQRDLSVMACAFSYDNERTVQLMVPQRSNGDGGDPVTAPKVRGGPGGPLSAVARAALDADARMSRVATALSRDAMQT